MRQSACTPRLVRDGNEARLDSDGMITLELVILHNILRGTNERLQEEGLVHQFSGGSRVE